MSSALVAQTGFNYKNTKIRITISEPAKINSKLPDTKNMFNSHGTHILKNNRPKIKSLLKNHENIACTGSNCHLSLPSLPDDSKEISSVTLPKPADGSRFFNIFGRVSLPKEVLGQNLFPRKYVVFFELEYSGNNLHHVQLQRFEVRGEPLFYLDKVVQNAFLKKLKNIDTVEFNQFMNDVNQQYNSSSVEGISGKVRNNIIELELNFTE